MQYIKTQGLLIDTEKNEARILGNTFLVSSNSVSMMGQNSNVNYSVAIKPVNSNIGSGSISFNSESTTLSGNSIDFNSKFIVADKNSVSFANSYNSNLSSSIGILGNNEILNSSISLFGKNNTISLSGVSLLSQNLSSNNKSFTVLSDNVSANNNVTVFNTKKSKIENNSFSVLSENVTALNDSISFNSNNSYLDTESLDINGTRNKVNNNSISIKNTDSNISNNSFGVLDTNDIVDNNSVSINGNLNTLNLQSVNILSTNTDLYNKSFSVNSTNSTLINNALAFNTIGSGISSSSIDFNGTNNNTSVSSINILSDNNRVSNKSFAINSSNNTISSNSEAFNSTNSTILNNSIDFNSTNSTLVNNALAFNTIGSGISSSSIDFNGIGNTTSVSSINILSDNNRIINKSFAINSSNNTVSSNSEAFNTRNSTILNNSTDFNSTNSTLINNALAFNTIGSGISSSSIDFNGTNNNTSVSSINILSDNNRVSNKSFAINSSNNTISSNSEAFNTRNSTILNNSIDFNSTNSTLVNNALAFNTIGSGISSSSIDFNGIGNTTSVSSINILSDNNRVSNKSFTINSSNNTVSSNSEAFNSRNSTILNNSIDFNGIGNTTSVSSINILSDNNRVSNKSFAINSSNNTVSLNSEAFNSTNSTLVNNALSFNTIGSGISSSSIDFNGIGNTTSVSSINILSDNNRVSNKSFAINSSNNTVSLNSEAFNSTNSTLVNNALSFNTIGSGISSSSIDFNGTNNNTSVSSINILSDNNRIINKSFSINSSNNTLSSNSEAFNTTNSTLINNALAFNTIGSGISSSSIDFNGIGNTTSVSSINILSDNNRIINKSFAINSSNNTVSSNSEAFNSTNSTILNNSIDFNGTNNNTSVSSINILSDNNRVSNKSFAINSSNNTISSNSEAFNTRNSTILNNSIDFNSTNSTLVNNALAFNTIGSGISSSSIDFNGIGNTTSVSSINILSDNNRVSNKSFTINSSNNTVSSNSEAFNTTNSTLVNNALAFNTIGSNITNESTSVNSTGVNSSNKSLDIFGTTNTNSNSSISINSNNTTTVDRSLSVNTTNSTISSRSFSLGSNNSTVILSSIDLFGSNNNLQNTSIGIAGSNVISTKGNTHFFATKNSELNSTNSLAIGGTNITQSLCANNIATGNNILTIGGNSNKVGSNSLVIGGTNNLISNNSVSIGGSNNNTSTYSNILMLNVNNTTADRSNLVYLPATYVLGDIIVNGKLSASGGVFEIDKSILASDSAIRINNTFSPSAALVIEQGNASYNVAEFKFGISKKPVFYIGSDGVSVNTSVLNPANALTVNGDISANKNINLINSSVLNIGDTNLYRSAVNTIKTDDNFVVGTLESSITDNSVIVENSGTLRKRTINNRVWDTNATFLSGVGLTTNNLPKAEGPNKLIPSNISDNGSQVDINVTTKIFGNAYSLRLEGLNHTYIEWYPQTLANGRKAWTGFGSTGDNKFSIVNQISDGTGHVNLIPGANANVGISTNTGFVPSKLLTISGVASASSSVFSGGTALVRVQGSTAQFSEPAIEFAELSLSPTARIVSKNVANGGGDLIFQTRDTTSSTSSLFERMRITGDGNVGIGTGWYGPGTGANISARLHVHGGITNDSVADFMVTGSGGWTAIHNNSTSGSWNGLVLEGDKSLIFTSGTIGSSGGFVIGPWRSGFAGLKVSSEGNIGIGTATPTGRLSFANIIDTRKITLWDGRNDNNRFYGFGVEGNTLVYSVDTSESSHVFFSGIDSTSRRELLRIEGSGAVSLSAGNIKLGNNYGLTWSANTDAASVRFESTGDQAGQSRLILETQDNGDEPIILRQTGNDRLYVGTGGRVGIGTSSPVAKLDVQSLVINEPSLFLKPPSGTYGNRSILGLWSTFISAGPLPDDFGIRRSSDIVSGFSVNNWGNEYLSFNVGNNGAANDTHNLTIERMRITGNGNVGIGTTLPTTRLHLSGSNTTFRIDSTTGNSAIQLSRNFTGSSSLSGYAIYLDSSNAGNNLRINRDNPIGTGAFNYLTFTADNRTQFTGNTYFNTSRSGGNNHVTIHGYQSNNGYGVLSYTAYNGTSDVNTSEITGLITSHTSGLESGGLIFNTRNSGTMSEKVRITPSGNVGIGTDNPYSGLHVRGTNLTDDFAIVVENTSQNGYSSISFGSENPLSGLGSAGVWRNGANVTGYAGASSLNIGSSISNTNLGIVTNNTTRMIVLSSGNIGIRTLTPNAALTINGDVSSNSQIFARGITITPVASSDITADLTLASPNNSLDVTWFYNNLTTGGYNPLSQIGDKGIIFSTGLSPSEGNMIIGPWSSAARGIVIDGINGRVGINKRPALATFDVNGTIGSSGNLSVSGGQVYVGRQNSIGEGGEIVLARSSDNTANWYIDSSGTTDTPNLRFFNEVNNVGTVRMTIDGSSGNVGIGNFSNPSFPLSFGASLGNKIALWDSGNGIGFGFGIQGGMMQIFSQLNTNRIGLGFGNSSAFTETLTVRGSNVGVGNANPVARLAVGNSLTGTAASTVFTTNAGSLSSVAFSRLKLASIGFQSSNQSSLGIEALRVSDGTNWETTAVGLKLDVDDTSSVNNTEIWLRANGCVGIGTGSPTSKLQVAGEIVATSSASKRIYIGGDATTTDVEIGTLDSDVTELHVYNRANATFLATKMANLILTNIATSTTDNSVIVESSGVTRKRTINSRVWDTNATFLSGSGTVGRLAMHTGPSTIGSSTISDNGTNTVFSRQAIFDVPSTGTSLSVPQLAFNSTNNGLFYNNTDGLMTTIGGLEKFRVNANYVYSSNKLGIGTTTVGTEMLSVAGSIKYGSMSFPSFDGNIDFGADAAGTWRKLIDANLVNILYSTIGFVIEITDPRANHVSEVVNATVETIKFNVACIRTQALTLDSPDACYVSGPVSGMIRAVRLSTGNYEIQIANRVLNQEYYVKIYAYAANGGHTINYYGGTTATVVTTQTVYNSVGGQKTEYFDKGIFTGTGNHDYGHYLQLKEIAAGNSDGPKILFEKNTPNKRWSIGSAKGSTDNGFGIYEGSSTTSEGTNRLYLSAGGNVGVGTTSPSSKLEISGTGNTGLRVTSTDNQSPFIDFIRAGTGNHDWRIKNDNGNGLRIYVSTDILATETHQVSISSNGNVGIGQTDPLAKLSIYDSTNADINLQYGTNQLWWITANESGLLKIGGNGAGRPASGAINITSTGNVGIGTTNPGTNRLQVNGAFAATTKAFIIDHPTKPNKKLQYACLEGPENGVYVRGRTNNNIIELPDYWINLVHEESITVNLTPIGESAIPRIKSIYNNKVEIFSKETGKLDYYYTIFAERKDVNKLEIEL